MSLVSEKNRDKGASLSPMITQLYQHGNSSGQDGQSGHDNKQLANDALKLGDGESITANGVHTSLSITTTPLPTVVQPPSPTAAPISASESDLEDVPSSNAEDVSPTEGVDAGQIKRPRTIRFNSRVRITSGVGRSHKTSHKEHSGTVRDVVSASLEPFQFPPDDGNENELQPPMRTNSTQSMGSNASGSYSSSIMVPLRSSSELPPRPNSMRLPKQKKPISDILDPQDANAWLNSLAAERRRRKEKRRATNNERAPLLRGAAPHPENDQDLADDTDGDISDDDIANSQSPWRYLSLYYWEARLSSICCCDSESED